MPEKAKTPKQAAENKEGAGPSDGGAGKMRKKRHFSTKEFAEKRKKKSRKYRFLRLRTKEKVMFAKHLSVMLDAGIPLREALEVIEDQVSSKSLRIIIHIMIKDLTDGFTLSSSLSKFPHAFKPFSVNIVRVGEASGTLSNALRYQSDQLQKSHELQGKIRAALFYPLIIFVGAIGIASYLSFYILPKLIPLFRSLNITLPITTRVLLASSEFIVDKWFIVVIGTILFFALIIFLYRIRSIKYFVHRTTLYIPVLGRLVISIQVSFFTRILGTLLMSGVQIVQAIKVTSESTSNLVYKRALARVARNVERGEAITEELVKNQHLFPRITTGMVKVGDRTGKLAESLMTAADFSEREVDDLTKSLSTLIEPLTLLLVGALVGFIALSIVTPIYQLTQGVSQ
jgi:type IV pilus assembly protein PilC